MVREGSIYYAVQGLYRGEWTTLFSPLSASEARHVYDELVDRNPACKYRMRWFSKPSPDNPAIEEMTAAENQTR